MYYQLTLSGTYSETGPQTSGLADSLGAKATFRYDHFYSAVERVLKNKRVKTVLVNYEMDFEPGFLSGIWAIRSQLVRLAQGGKELVFFARQYGTHELMLASLCQRRAIHPLGSVVSLGASRSFRFYKNLMDKHNIRAEIIRIGRYKSAGDSFRVSEIDEYNKAQYQRILESVVEENEGFIAQGYGKSVSEVQALREAKPLSAQQAVERNWAGEIATLDDIIAEFAEANIKPWKLKKTLTRCGKGAKVAVLVFEGGIKDGHNEKSQLSGQMVGSSDFVPAIRALAKDKSVKGVIFRINSGGGSATASEDISRELARVQKKKPVVVSMGPVAGSGGYWIAAEAERIFAEPTTLTGSIGVLGIHFNVADFLAHYGITHSTLNVGSHSDMYSALRDLRDDEREMLIENTTLMYDLFREKVAAGRNMSAQQVHQLGEGHVYSGVDALENGLVDEIGGLDAARQWMAEKLGATCLQLNFVPQRKVGLLSRLIGGGGKTSPYAALLTGMPDPRNIAAAAERVNRQVWSVIPGFWQ